MLELDLADRRRAGAHSRKLARDMQVRFIRRSYRGLLALLVIPCLAIAPSAYFLKDELRGFLLGATVAASVGATWYVISVFSGSATSWMGEQGELWTNDELATLQKHGWMIAHGVRLREFGDIDSVAIGPGGLVVIETKWSSDAWDTTSRKRRIVEAADYLVDAATPLKNVLKRGTGTVPVYRVIALWPSPDTAPGAGGRDVVVLPGLELGSWILQRERVVEDEQIAAGWAILEGHMRARDRRDGPIPLTSDDYVRIAYEWIYGVIGGGLLVTLPALSRDSSVTLLGMPVVLVGTLVVRRVARLHRVATAAFVGECAAIVAAVIKVFLLLRT
jgi:hypothetical protein